MEVIQKYINNNSDVCIICKHEHIEIVYKYIQDNYSLVKNSYLPIDYLLDGLSNEQIVYFYRLSDENRFSILIRNIIDDNPFELNVKIIKSSELVRRIKISKLERNKNI